MLDAYMQELNAVMLIAVIFVPIVSMGPSSCERCQVDGRCTEVCFESLLKIMELKL